jgi:tetratricopeptide (TPR) repeat protein
MPPPSSGTDDDAAASGVRHAPAGSEPEGHQTARSVRRTLPPPEWIGREGPRSAASLALERYQLDGAVARRSGPRAELASLFARLETAGGDEALERSAAAALARSLATRGTELDAATRLGRRALLLGEDPALREELAGWFVSLGEPALAAAALRPLVPERGGPDAATLLVRIGVLLARAGEARAASDAFADAALLDPSDPVSVEARASLSAWAPEAESSEQAAEAYLQAAERREARGERAAAFENLMRAFEVDPAHARAAEQLALSLLARGRIGAADEVRREHAEALGQGKRPAHVRRMRQAVKDGDLPRALGAALDARLDAEIDLRSVLAAIDPDGGAEEAPLGIDGLLERANLHELLAARVEIASDFLAGRERARARLALGRLYTGPLGRPDRAVEAWIDALVADPACEAAHEALRRHGVVARDYSPLVEALVRVGDAKGLGALPERIACLRELVNLAEERLGDPLLALWATGRLDVLVGESEELRGTALRLAPRARLADETLAEARAELSGAEGADRVGPLLRVASLLSGRPDAPDAYLEVLRELVELMPDERSHALAAERVLSRLGRHAELEVLLARQASRTSSAVERARVRLMLATLRRRRGDAGGALRELVPLLGEAGAHAPAWNFTLLLAAQSDDNRSRALALSRIAAQLPPSLRAVLMAVSAEELLATGDIEGARVASEQACNADPSLARPAAARARVGLVVGGRWGAEAIERALGIIVPRPALCATLAAIYDELAEPLLAATWAQRLGTLRPGDLEAARSRIQRSLASDDGSRLADTLAWFLSQPQWLAPAADTVADAIERLARIAPGRAAALARRALDVLGPRDPALRSAALKVADAIGERGLGIAVVERWLATGSLGGERWQVLLDLSRRRKAAGDADGAARAFGRALHEGAPAREAMSELDAALPTRSSDGEISLLAARAEALSALPEADQQGTVQAWRELGAALWDLASDRAGAFKAWERALALDSERGPDNYASDLIAFAGEGTAIERLNEQAERRGEQPEAARFHALSARIALAGNRLKEAFEHARRALEIDSSRSDPIAIAERSASDSELEELDALYEWLANQALGRFGERAIRYRAARQLEKRGQLASALKHAAGAFEAVPSEGVVFVTLARLADRGSARGEMVRSIERVAQASERPEQRAAWLRRAAVFAGDSEEGQRQRVDVLLRALAVRADADLVASLAQAMAGLVRLEPDERDASELRFARAAGSLLERVDGPEGARVALEVARSALGTFQARSLALAALERAAVCDGDIEGFATLAEFASELARAPDAAAWVLKLVARSARKFESTGVELLELGAGIAELLGDAESSAKLLIAAAARDPERQELVRRADQAARKVGDPELIALVLDIMPDRGRFALVMELASAAERAGNVLQALEALERARELSDLDPDQRRTLRERTLELLQRSGRRDELELALGAELARPGLEEELVPRLASELAALVGARGRPLAALAVLLGALERVPDHPSMLADVAAFARQGGDRERQAWALAKLLDLGPDPAHEAVWLRELAALLDGMGDSVAALARWAALHALDPNDAEALVALERDAEQRGDHETLARLLDRRAALAGRVDDVRRLRLRRATVLEQRLARPDEARAELETLLAATGDHVNVLRVLADLDERLGEPLSAAPLWLRAAALASDRDEAVELTRLACQAYLGGGDVEAAFRVLEGMGGWAERPRLLELRAEVERRRENPLGLADALDELATLSREPAEQRAALLVEAARASLAGGDSAAGLERAMRAARVEPSMVEAQLLARRLEYLARGVGSADDARTTLADLASLTGTLTPAQAELRAFLRAEALERVEGPERSLAELERASSELGQAPLIALGIAERLAASGRPAEALAAFDTALAGELHELRQRPRVALLAGEAARRAGELERAERYLEESVSDPVTQASARAALEIVRSELAQRRAVLSAGAVTITEAAPGPDAERFHELSAAEPSPPTTVRAHIVIDADDDGPSVEISAAAPGSSPDAPESAAPPSPPPSSRRRGRQQSVSGTFVASSDEEIALHLALVEGSREAGAELLDRLALEPERTHDRLAVHRRLAMLDPGDPGLLEQLAQAAREDRDSVHATAVLHVLEVVRPRHGPIEPPPLEEVSARPDQVRALLFREMNHPALETLALVWDTAEHLFRRDPGAYGITGLERVQASAPTPLGRTYAAAGRAIGAVRTPLFQRRSAGPITVGVALLAPPAVVLSGDVQTETRELSFHVGAMLAAASPQLVMLFGLPESQARSVLRALAFAFGPARPDASGLGAALNLAEMLWEAIPARPQRRLRELCNDPGALDYDRAMEQARIAVRRAGLFVTGDWGVAAREVCIDEGLDPGLVSTPGGLAKLCERNSSLRNLHALALSSEYADTRWRGARPGPRAG